MTLRNKLLLLVLLPLGGCGPLVDLGGGGPAPDLYAVARVEAPAGLVADPPISIQVDEPDALSELLTERIALRMSDTEIKYYAGARWSDRPGRLLRDRLIETLENVPGVVALDRDLVEVRADYKLKLRLRDFSAHHDGDAAPQVVIEFSAILLDANARVIGQHPFRYQGRAAAISPAAVVGAVNLLSAQAIDDLARWAVATAK